ncbi:MAG: hypothetical protein KUG82_21895 [Pseudomonadales bacterium]|nr:hypothetical protein [Pseudomonadales bacterium]
MKQILSMKALAPEVYFTLAIWFFCEMFAVFILPFCFSDAFFMSLYMDDKAKISTARFLNNENANIPDSITGWFNKPNEKRKHWVTDQYGSRSANPAVIERNNKTRVIFLGSSMVNGGEGVANNETMSAYLDSETREAFNFASMSYSVDQSLLTYRSKIKLFEPDILVVGIDPTPITGLYNHYIPFKIPEETSMPYLKPRFKLRDDELVEIRPNQNWLKSYLTNDEFHHFLKKNDAYFRDFEQFQSFGFTPIAQGLFALFKRVRSFVSYYYAEGVSDPLLEKVMDTFVMEAAQEGTKVYFAILPNQRMYSWSGIWQFFPDVYQLRVNALGLEGFNTIDIRQTLIDSGYSGNELFHDDEWHYRRLANEIIGEAIKVELNKSENVKL